MIFTMTLQNMLKQDLTLQILKETDRCLEGKNKNIIGPIKDELGGQIMKECVGLTARTQSYLKENNDKDNKPRNKKGVIKKLKFQDYKNCLKEAQIDRKIKYLEKKNMNNLKEFLKAKLY